jgi:hypothetical protein
MVWLFKKILDCYTQSMMEVIAIRNYKYFSDLREVERKNK